MRLRVEYTWDHEDGTWVFALEATPDEVDPSARVGHLEVTGRVPTPAVELPA